MEPAGEEEVLGLQPGVLNPRLHSVSSCRRNLELLGALRPMLHDDCAGCDLLAMADVPDSNADEITSAQLAIDAEVEQRELAHSALHLQADAQRPDVLQLEIEISAGGDSLVTAHYGS